MIKRDIDYLKNYTYELAGDYGLGHSLRLIELVKLLANGRTYNEDVIAFCAYVHDFGAYPKYIQAGVDHPVRTIEILPEYISLFDFSEAEKDHITETILRHHSGTTPSLFDAILFRDADSLDFLGFMGIARDFLRANKDVKKAVASIIEHRRKLPGMLSLPEAKDMAKERIIEMDSFLERFDIENFQLF